MRRAVAASPADIALRVHLAELLEAAGERDEAVSVIAAVVATEPENVRARSVMLRLLSPPSSRPSAPSADPDPVPETPIEESPFDWGSAEDQVANLFQPAFVETDDTS
ncbi:tetratricopeptide repeat protein [Frondihabitans sp. 762G35]|uniref:tetratricopeptide repeat protein n=1 Tax=Frondihabitans sp. 762G35 TaxID=1446794 RepID=UPI003FA41CC2